MADEWKEASIGEVAERVAMGPFGSSIKVETFVPSGVPIISGQHLHGSKVNDHVGFNFVSEEHAERLRNANVKRGDVIFTHAGNIGQVAYIPDSSHFERYVISQRQFYMRCNRKQILPEFVVAYFKTPEGQHQLLANTSQVGVPSIAQPVTYLRTIEVPLPPLPEQRVIAHILGTLDDKIELNRQMNETLEAMARALFKSWFVDFDPVRAKMEGRDPGLPKHIADLFPDRLVGSELGEIPEGWEVATIKRCCERVQNGGTPRRNEPRFWVGAGIPWLTSGEVRQPIVSSTDNYISEAGLAESSAKWVEPLSTVVALYGATAGQVSLVATKLTTNQAVCALIPREHFAFFNYFLLRNSITDLENKAVGSAQQNISKAIVEETPAIVPSLPLLIAYRYLVEPLIMRWISSLSESRILTALRDTLLPKLISGELRIKDAEKFVERAT